MKTGQLFTSSYQTTSNVGNAPPPSTSTMMRMEQMYTKTRSILRRLDHLESCLSSRVARHRRRATNILDVTSSTRRTHVRYVKLFITYCQAPITY